MRDALNCRSVSKVEGIAAASSRSLLGSIEDHDFSTTDFVDATNTDDNNDGKILAQRSLIHGADRVVTNFLSSSGLPPSETGI